MNRASLIFCAASVAGSLLVAMALFPLASLPEQRLDAWHQAMPAYEMGDVDLGEFGVVSVQELVDYYVDNPPAPVTGAAPSKPRFQGC